MTPIEFQSTLPSRGATELRWRKIIIRNISIHAPLAGSDMIFSVKVKRVRNFNPRSPRGERPVGGNRKTHPTYYFNPRSPRGERPKIFSVRAVIFAFQSTLPSRGATIIRFSNKTTHRHFNPRSPRGERQTKHAANAHHAYFNPRSPRGERHYIPHGLFEQYNISIHAPLAGSDLPFLNKGSAGISISIHAPLAGSDVRSNRSKKFIQISIHAPLAGSDGYFYRYRYTAPNFNPRSPRGERRTATGRQAK